jgi:histidine ammonia-lyase
MMALKLLSLGRGASGVRWEVIALIEDMLAAGVTPVIPAQGSVGASGDLAPLAHMAAAMIGEGEAEIGGGDAGAAALARRRAGAGRAGPKEGLALINGTQFSTACALAGLFEARRLRRDGRHRHLALSTDAIMGSTAPLQPEIHALRGQPGQIDVAAAMRALMAGSRDPRKPPRRRHPRAGPLLHPLPAAGGRRRLDLLRQAGRTLEIEANAVTDNPLVLAEAGDDRLGRQLPRRTGRLRRRPDRAGLPRSAPSPSAASR